MGTGSSNIWRAKMRINTEFGLLACQFFLMVLKIFDNESVNSKFKYQLEYEFKYKLGGFYTREQVPGITDYK